MFCLEYPSRSKPHEFQQRQECDNDDKTMAGRLEELDKTDRLLPFQPFQNRVHPLPNRQVVGHNLHESLARIAIEDSLQNID